MSKYKFVDLNMPVDTNTNVIDFLKQHAGQEIEVKHCEGHTRIGRLIAYNKNRPKYIAIEDKNGIPLIQWLHKNKVFDYFKENYAMLIDINDAKEPKLGLIENALFDDGEELEIKNIDYSKLSDTKTQLELFSNRRKNRNNIIEKISSKKCASEDEDIFEQVLNHMGDKIIYNSYDYGDGHQISARIIGISKNNPAVILVERDNKSIFPVTNFSQYEIFVNDFNINNVDTCSFNSVKFAEPEETIVFENFPNQVKDYSKQLELFSYFGSLYKSCLKRKFFKEANILAIAAKSTNFDLDKFKSLIDKDLVDYEENDALNYIKSKLRYLGSGASRKVFLLNSKKVIKVAYNSFGQKQNKKEVKIASNEFNDSVTTKIFDYDKDYIWVIAELVRPITKQEFKEYFGVAPYDLFNPNAFDELSKDKQQLISSVRKHCRNLGINTGDLDKANHWGKTTDGNIVILDYGV